MMVWHGNLKDDSEMWQRDRKNWSGGKLRCGLKKEWGMVA